MSWKKRTFFAPSPKDVQMGWFPLQANLFQPHPAVQETGAGRAAAQAWLSLPATWRLWLVHLAGDQAGRKELKADPLPGRAPPSLPRVQSESVSPETAQVTQREADLLLGRGSWAGGSAELRIQGPSTSGEEATQISSVCDWTSNTSEKALLGRTGPAQAKMATRRSHPPLLIHLLMVLLIHLLMAMQVLGQEEDQEGGHFGETCLAHFTTGLPEFVLDTDASVANGATFLSSPHLTRGKDCVRACCKQPDCNLALVEQAPGEGEDSIQNCFLLNCLYDQNFVCKFAKKAGFLNYVKKDAYDTYVAGREHHSGGDRPPVARAWMEIKVQPNEPVTLRGSESSDDNGIVSYEWTLLHGDPSVVMEKEADHVVLNNLQEGTYIFQLTVMDAVEQQASTNITVTVLNAEQTIEHCLAPSKVGRCRGAFPRWYYNPVSEKCESFIFGGCHANKNNYIGEEECKLACMNVQGSVEKPQEPVCNGECLPHYFKCGDGCCIDSFLECDENPDCLDESDEKFCDIYIKGFNKLRKINATSSQSHCLDLPDTGECTESIPRWFYDPFTERCDRFTYGGCKGNKNNFAEEEECLKSCEGITKVDVIVQRGPENHGNQAGLSSFESAIAVLLCMCIAVVLAILGYFFLKNRKGYRRRRQPSTAANSTLSSVLSTTEDTEHLVYNSTTKPI